MSKWEKILVPLDKNKRFWSICVGISACILIIATAVNTWNDSSKEIILLSYICDIIIALATAILGTFALNIIYNLAECHKITEISKVSYEDLLPDLLTSLEKFNGRFRKDESILVKLDKYNETIKKDFYKVILEYQYTTNLLGLENLKFVFYRDFSNINKYIGGLNSEHIICDFMWGVDESGFSPNKIKNNDYNISELIIGENTISNISQYRTISKKGDCTIISYNIPISELNNINKKKTIQLSYRVTVPLVKEDLLVITHEMPTQNAKITFDYSNIKNEIDVYGMPITGTIAPISPNEDEDNKITYIISGWILPKQGYIFGWWKKWF